MSLGPLDRVSRITEDEPSLLLPKLGFGWIGVPTTWVQVPSWVLAGFEFQHMGSSPSLVNGFTPTLFPAGREASLMGLMKCL